MLKIKNQNKITYFLNGIISFVFTMLLISPALAAENPMLNDGSSFATTFKIKLVDQKDSKFSLEVNGKNISDPSFYNPTGNTFNFSFEAENYLTGEKYIINNLADQNYGTLKTKPGIRFLPGSNIKLIEPDSGTFLDSDDKISLNLRSTGTENRISIDTKNTTLTAGDTDLDWEASDDESILNELQIDLKLQVPLEGKTVTATIKGDKNGFVFDSGLNGSTTLSSNNNGLTGESTNENSSAEDSNPTDQPNTNSANPTDSEEQFLQRPIDPNFKETKLEGAGLRSPGKSAYQSMSDQKNLVQWIVALTNFTLNFVTYIAMLMLLYGAYLWITSAGEEGNSEKAKKIIAGSIIGILLIISAYTIVSTVIDYNTYNEDYCQANIKLSETPEYKLKCRVGNSEISTDNAGIGGILGKIF